MCGYSGQQCLAGRNQEFRTVGRLSPHSRMKRDVGAANAALEAPAGASTPCRETFALSIKFVFNHMKFKMIFYKTIEKANILWPPT